jgi:hypothetical protein
MELHIYQIGGGIYNDSLVGIAHDTHTMRSLIELAELRRATGVSLHGTLPHVREAVSVALSLPAAKQEYSKAVDAVNAVIMDGIDPPEDDDSVNYYIIRNTMAAEAVRPFTKDMLS